MTVKTQRKANAAPVSYKVKSVKKARNSAPKSNGKDPLAVYDHIHVGIVKCSLNGQYTDVNEEFCRILGYSKEELLQFDIKQYTHEEDYALDIKLHEQLVAGKIPFYALEKRYIRKDGQIVWVELTRSLVRDEKGKPVCTMGVVTDISEYKQVERVLRESAENLRIATEAARMFKWELDFQKQLYIFADNFVQVLGFSAGLLPQNSVETVWKLSPEEDVRAISEAIAKAIKKHSSLNSLQYRMINPEDGQTVWLEVNAKIVYDDKGNAQRMFGVAQNITQDKKAQEEIRILSKLPAENPNPVMRLTPDGTILYANPPAQDLLEVWKRQTRQAIPKELKKHIAEAFASGSKKEIELTQNGKTFVFTLAPIREAGYVNLYGTEITERRQIAQELAHERELLSRLFEAIPVMLTIYEPSTEVLRLNSQFEKLIGWNSQDVAGISLMEVCYPDPEYRAQVGQFMASCAPDEWMDIQMQTREGRTLETSWSNIRLSSDMQVGIGIDITERKHMEAELRKSEERFRALFNQATAGIAQSDMESRLIFVNPKLCEMLDYSESELIGKTLWELTDDRDLEENKGLFERMIAQGESYQFEKRFVRRDGATLWASVSVSAVHDGAGRPTGGVGVVVDITPRKQAEEALRTKESELQEIINRTPFMLTRCSRDLRYRFVSNAYAKMIGHTPEEVAGKSILEIMGEEGLKTISPYIEKVLQGDQVEYEREVSFHGVGAPSLHVIYTPDRDERGNVTGWFASINDVTERKRTEQALAEFARQQEALYQLSDQLHHTNSLTDVYNAALNAILSALQCDRASILLFDEAGVMRFVAWRELSEEYRKATEGHSPWSSDEKNPYPVCVSDVGASDLSDSLKATVQKEGIASLAFIPLVSNGKLIGKFMVYFNALHECNDVEIELGLMIARQLASGIERKQAEEQLRKSAEFDAFRVALTDALRPLNEPEEVLAEAIRVLGEKLQVDRVLYSEIEEDKETILILDNYVKEGVPKLIGQASLNDYGKARELLSAGRNLIIADATTSPDMDEKDRTSFAALGIRSGLAIPLIKGGRWVASLGVHQGSVRAWTENEIKFVEETAERTWSALERARTQEKLRASETLYRTIARSIPGGGVYVVDKEFRYLVAEGPVTEAFGLARERLEGHTVSEALGPETGAKMQERLQRNFAGETIGFEVTRDGHYYWTQQAPLHDTIGQAIIVTIDITERKQVEEALRQSEERFARFMQHLPGLAWIKDVQGRYVYANAAAEKAFNIPREQLYGKTDREIFPPNVAEQFRKNDEQALINEKRMQTVETLPQNDGVLHYSLVTKFPIPDADGNPTLIGGTAFDITERLQAEQALRKSEERYRSLFDLVPVAVYTCDANGLLQEYNHRALELWGREPKIKDPQEPKYCGSYKLYYPDGRFMPHEEGPMRRVLAGETLNRTDTEIVIERPDGSRRNVIVHPLPLRNERGEIMEAINCLYDITEHKQIEEALRIENERFMRFIDSNIVGILIGDTSGKVILANDYYLRLLGLSRQDFMDGKVDWMKFTPPEWLPADEKAIQQMRARGVCDPYEKEYIRTDGTRVPVYIADAMLPGPGEEIAAFVLDITERKHAEEALRESEERFSAILKQATAGIVRKDADGRFIFVNEAFCRMLGYSESELLGKTFWQFTYHEDIAENKRLYDRMMIEGTPFKLEKRITRKDGSLIWVDISVSPVMGAEGKPQSAVAVEVDITGRKQAEEALQQLNLQLESRVQKRTATIQAMNQSLRDEIAERKRIEEALRASEAIARASEEKLRTLFDLLPVGISFLDPEGQVIEMNSALLNILRLSKEQVLSQAYKTRKYIRVDGTPMPPTEFAGVRALAEEKTVYNVETGIVLENGEVIWTSVSAAPVDVAEVGVVVVTMDVTDSKRAERALQESHGRLRILSQRLVEVQEEERRALARELHDRVGQTLAALNINLIIINGQLSPEAAQQIGARLNDSMTLVGETIALVRDVMTDLRPAVLDDYGLEAALESHITAYKSRYNIKVQFGRPEQPIPRLGSSIEMTFLRIAQEALMNIARHAHAEHVNLSLRQADESICLTIQDDGIGIESWQDANRPGSHGLTIMRERAEAFGGTLKVQSVPGQGTLVEVNIPYNNNKSESQAKTREEQSL